MISTVVESAVWQLPKSLARWLLPHAYERVRQSHWNKRQLPSGEALWNNRLYGVINKIVGDSGVFVRGGPFAGMMYWPVGRPGSWAGGIASSLLGVYEMELHPWLERAAGQSYRRIINIGAAEGYYAVGLSRLLPEAEVYAFDVEAMARQVCAATAQVNGVAARVVVRGNCTVDALRALTAEPCFILSDCEGAELDLLRPDLVPGLSACDILVELHDIFRPGLSDALLPRFRDSHDVEIVRSRPRDPATFPQLQFLTPEELEVALDERRPAPMQWAMLTARAR